MWTHAIKFLGHPCAEFQHATFLQDVIDCLAFRSETKKQTLFEKYHNCVVSWVSKSRFSNEIYHIIHPHWGVNLWAMKEGCKGFRLCCLLVSAGLEEGHILCSNEPMNAHPNHSAPQTAHPTSHIQLLTNFRLIKIKISADKSLRTETFWGTIN